MAAPVLPQDLIVEILSWAPVKALMRFRCVSKTWNSLMSDPTFAKLHLQRSSRNTHVLLTFDEDMNDDDDALGAKSVICVDATPCSISRLLEDPSTTIDDCVSRFNETTFVFGSCNGLVCLRDFSVGDGFSEYWVRFWNPATRVMSGESPRLSLRSSNYETGYHSVKCGFGFDDSCDAYKVVVMLLDIKSQETEVRVHCLGDTCWRKTLTFPALTIAGHNGQFVSGTLNWLALGMLGSDYQWETVTMDQLVILSYDLKTETYRCLLMPGGLLEVPSNEPCLGVLKGCLCLSRDHKITHFAVWLMREFGIEKSWTQLLNVTYDHLLPDHGFPPCTVMPLCMSENEDLLLLADYGGGEFVIYNRRENRIVHTDGFNNKFSFFSYDYVQSLVLPY